MTKKTHKKNIETEVNGQEVNRSSVGSQQEETKAEESTQKKEGCEESLAELNKKLEELNDKYLRLAAEYDNYRKRTLKEKMELTKSAGESLILALLPVIDDFDRALAHLDEAKDMEAMKKGILLIYSKFKEFLSQQGVKEIEATNKDFDIDHHEAITKIPAPEEDMKGKVIDTVEKGYMLNDKVIRFAKVVVGE